jgi:hypothetical protein
MTVVGSSLNIGRFSLSARLFRKDRLTSRPYAVLFDRELGEFGAGEVARKELILTSRTGRHNHCPNRSAIDQLLIDLSRHRSLEG